MKYNNYYLGSEYDDSPGLARFDNCSSVFNYYLEAPRSEMKCHDAVNTMYYGT